MNLHFIWQELFGGLWHTTHPDFFQEILNTGAIVPEPYIDNGKRWKTSAGLQCYPYVRILGGVSLFDFENFDPNTYSKDYPLSNFEAFVPFRKDWRSAVWIEIDRAKVSEQFVSGADLIARWKAEGAYRHTIMPYIEAAFIGRLPRTAFVRAFVVRAGEDFCKALALPDRS